MPETPAISGLPAAALRSTEHITHDGVRTGVTVLLPRPRGEQSAGEGPWSVVI